MRMDREYVAVWVALAGLVAGVLLLAGSAVEPPPLPSASAVSGRSIRWTPETRAETSVSMQGRNK